MERVSATLRSLLLPALLWAAAAGQDITLPETAPDPQASQPAGAGVRERSPELYYIEDAAGRLVPVPGFRYRDFMELFRIKEGLGGPALPPPAVLESIVLEIDARGVADGAATCPVEVECRIRQAGGGWAMVPLNVGQLLLSGAPTHDGPGRMLLDADPAGDGYRCWFESPSAEPADGMHTVTLKGRLPVDRLAARESFTLRLPAAVASRLDIRSARRRPEVRLMPPAAGEIRVVAEEGSPPAAGDDATGKPAAANSTDPPASAAGSRISIAGLTGDVRISVGEAAGGLVDNAIPEATCESLVRIDGRTAVITATLSLANLPAGQTAVSISLPPASSLRRVGGDGEVAGQVPDPAARGPAGEPDAVEVVVDAGPDGSARLELQCERPVDPAGGGRVDPLGFVVGGFEPWRQRGRVSLFVEGDWQASWDDVPGIRRVDPPVGERAPGLVAVFAYDAQPASLPLRIRPRRSRVVVEPEYRYEVSSGRVRLAARLRVAARGAAISSIAVGLDSSWTLADVGPAGIVDADRVVVEGGQTVIPFVQPLAGEAVVEIEAVRGIAPTADRVAWELPTPRADLVGPAVVIVTSDSDIELVPDAGGTGGLVRQTSSTVQTNEPDRIPLVYRLDAAEGRFAAARRFVPRRVEAATTAAVAVDEREVIVRETLRLDVFHLPLEVLELELPAEVIASGTLDVRWNDEPLDVVEVDSRDGEEAAGGPLIRVQAVLPEPLLGRGEATVGYRLALPEIPPEATASVDLPLPLPVAADTIRQTVVITEPATLAVTPRDESWRPEVSGQPETGRSWSTSRPQQIMPLAVSARGQEAVDVTMIDAAWLRTRLFPDRREDLAIMVVTPARQELEMKLPEETATATTDIRIDGARVVPQPRGGGWVAIPCAAGSGRRLVEVRTVAPWGGRLAGLGLPWPLPLAPPVFAEDVVQRRFAWDVAVLADDHLLGVPSRWTSQQAWTWEGLGWQRKALVSTAELAGWIETTLGRNAVGISTGEWPVRERRSVFAGIGGPGKGTPWVVPTWCIVLTASGLTLLVGLALLATSAWRRPGLMTAMLAAVTLAITAVPDLVPLVAQAALPGGLLVGLAAFLRLLTTPAEAGRDRQEAGGGTSSLTRTAAPAASLIVASPATAGSTATAARDAS